MEDLTKKIFDGIMEGRHKDVSVQVKAALDAGVTAEVILNDGMVAAMAEVGRLFEEGEYYVPEMLIAARAMQAGMAVLKPRLIEAKVQ